MSTTTPQSLIESILFVSDKPVSSKKIALIAGCSAEDARKALECIAKAHSPASGRGIILVCNDDKYQFATHPDHAGVISGLLKDDVSGELTRPALETLSVISYRGPATKPQIEEIRGVNCSLSLRNLLIRGLIEFRETGSTGEKLYTVSHDYIRSLGISRIEELPNYRALNSAAQEGNPVDSTLRSSS